MVPPGSAHHPHPPALPPEEPARRRSPSPYKSGGAGDGRTQSWTKSIGGWERTSGVGHPAGRPGPPSPERPAPRPPAVRTARGDAPPPV